MIAEAPYYHNIGFITEHAVPGVMSHSHRHLEIEVNFLERGSVTYLMANGLQTISSGQLGAFWGTLPHRVVETGEDSSFFLLYIPLTRFLAWSLPGNLTSNLLSGGMAVDRNEANSLADYVMFPRWHRDMSSGDPEKAATVYLEIEARLRRLSQSIECSDNVNIPTPQMEGVRKHEPELLKVQQIIAVIAERYADELSVSDVAEAVGLHPKYAMSLFHRALGITILNYITQHRMSHAQRLLATTDAKIVDVACSSGFGSVSRFYEVFREVCGGSPNDYRQHIAKELGSVRRTK